jgi:hypothetical protein
MRTNWTRRIWPNSNSGTKFDLKFEFRIRYFWSISELFCVKFDIRPSLNQHEISFIDEPLTIIGFLIGEYVAFGPDRRSRRGFAENKMEHFRQSNVRGRS